jgi:hypothetical protein
LKGNPDDQQRYDAVDTVSDEHIKEQPVIVEFRYRTVQIIMSEIFDERIV